MQTNYNNGSQDTEFFDDMKELMEDAEKKLKDPKVKSVEIFPRASQMTFSPKQRKGNWKK